MDKEDVKKLGLMFALQSEVEGMLSANIDREQNNEAMAYTDIDFTEKAEQMRNIVELPITAGKPRIVANRRVTITDVFEINGIFEACIHRLQEVKVSDSQLKYSVEKDQILTMLEEGRNIIQKYIPSGE
jgi:ribosomal protein L17